MSVPFASAAYRGAATAGAVAGMVAGIVEAALMASVALTAESFTAAPLRQYGIICVSFSSK